MFDGLDEHEDGIALATSGAMQAPAKDMSQEGQRDEHEDIQKEEASEELLRRREIDAGVGRTRQTIPLQCPGRVHRLPFRCHLQVARVNLRRVWSKMTVCFFYLQVCSRFVCSIHPAE